MKEFICVLILLFLFSGCSSAKVPISNSDNKETSSLQSDTAVYLTEIQNSKNNVAILFEDVEIYTDEEKNYFEREIAYWLKETTDEEFSLAFSENVKKPGLDNYEQYLVDLQGKTTYRSEQIASVIFQGMINLKSAAHPMHVFFSLNYNPKTLETIDFLDIHSVTEELYIAFALEGEKTIKEKNGGEWPQGLGGFSEVFCSKEAFLRGMEKESPIDQRIYFYYTEEKTGFSFSTVHALGGHIEVELSRSLLQKTENKR